MYQVFCGIVFIESVSHMPEHDYITHMAKVIGHKGLSVVKVADEGLVHILLHHPDISPFIAGKLAGDVLLVRRGDLEEFVRTLQREGYTPAVDPLPDNT